MRFDLSNKSSSCPTGLEGEGKWPKRGSGVCRFHGRVTRACTQTRAYATRTHPRSGEWRSSWYTRLGTSGSYEYLRRRWRERENRIGRRERAELRSAELPFLRTCLAASSSSPTDYDRLLLSLFCVLPHLVPS